MLILSAHQSIGLPDGLFTSGFPTEILYAFIFAPNSFYMPLQSHSPWRNHSNYIWRRVQFMKLLIMQCSPVTSSLFGPNILLSTLFLNTLRLCSYSPHFSLSSFHVWISICIESCGAAVAPGSYSVGAWFDPRPGHQQFWLRFLVVYPSPLKQLPVYCLYYATVISFQILSKSSSIVHTTVKPTLFFYTFFPLDLY
jgi:hypothetical protein